MAELADRTAGLKERLQIQHTPYAQRAPSERVHDFDEIVLGYVAETAQREAARCLQCPAPSACSMACPLHNDIPLAMWLIAQGDFLGAAAVYRRTSIFPEICGRVCPQERLCEGACVLGRHDDAPSLGKLEMFVGDYQRLAEGATKPVSPPRTGKEVAVVGSGPAGLAVAEALRLRGHGVTVYEAAPYPGGLLLYGIPNFKLPKGLVFEKVDYLRGLGVEFVCNTRVGQNVSIDDLFLAGFQAVFLGVGANMDIALTAPGIELDGVHLAGELLVRTSPPRSVAPKALQTSPDLGRRVAVIGGGDTATDCLRTALRLGAEEVVCYYRRTEAEMPGSRRERQNALDEGAQVEYLTAPVRFIGDSRGRVTAMELQRMALGEPDRSGRRRPMPVSGSEFTVPVDTVVLALGYGADDRSTSAVPGLQTHDHGLVEAAATGVTSRPGVFAGGDVVTGPDLVATAVAAGLRAAKAIDEYLKTA